MPKGGAAAPGDRMKRGEAARFASEDVGSSSGSKNLPIYFFLTPALPILLCALAVQKRS